MKPHNLFKQLMDMEKRLPDEQDKGQHNMKSEMVSPMPNKEPTMQSTQNWEPELRRIAVAWSHGDENYQTLVSFIHSVEEKSMEREWKRCIDVLDREHSKCPIPESCIGYQNAQSDLINNHPKQVEINI